MEQLTKEHFERVVATLATKDDLTALATVKGLAQLEKNLSRQTQELVRMVKKGGNYLAGPKPQKRTPSKATGQNPSPRLS